MKQPDDKYTTDMLPPPKRGRGRPRGITPALPGAQRQKALRDRLNASGAWVVTVTIPAEMQAWIASRFCADGSSKTEAVFAALCDAYRAAQLAGQLGTADPSLPVDRL